jgi:23S rRNA pseudouridine1911/1915/1917 synthase
MIKLFANNAKKPIISQSDTVEETISYSVVLSIYRDIDERADRLLSQFLGFSRSRIQKNILNENLLVNGKLVAKSSYSKFRRRDEIEFEIDPVEQLSAEPEKMDLNIVFENEYFLVVDKPAGLVVHPGAGNYSGTLVNGLVHYLGSNAPGNFLRPGLVHRIDKDTSGLLVVAKREDVFEELQSRFLKHDIEREYVALVGGRLKKSKGKIDTYHGRDPGNRLRFSADVKKGRRAITNYETISEYPHSTLLKLSLETGRTHQIRMHLAHIGHPIINDALYGGISKTSDLNLNKLLKNSGRQLLHARKLGFNIFCGKYCFTSDLPGDFLSITTYLDNISGGY